MNSKRAKSSNLFCVDTNWTVSTSRVRLCVCFQRHKEYIKMLKERKEALGELQLKECRWSFYWFVTLENLLIALFFFLFWSHLLEAAEDDLEEAITSTTEAVQYDHPNHTVTVTTISDLDLTMAHRLGPVANQVKQFKPWAIVLFVLIRLVCRFYCLSVYTMALTVSDT